MPAFEKVLLPKEIESVIVYLKTFWTTEQRQFQKRENRKNSAVSTQFQEP